MKVKIITCIYSDLSETKFGGRPSRKDHYRFSLLSLIKMSHADFTCYTSEREIEDLKSFFYDTHQIPKERIEFITFDLQQNPAQDLIDKIRGVDTINKSDRCYEIQYSKFSWFKNESKLYDYYYWFDSGLSHTGIIPDKYLSNQGYRGYFESDLFTDKFLENLVHYTEDKFLIIAKDNLRNYWDGTVPPKFYKNFDSSVHIVGGFFGGKKEIWDDIVNLFEGYLRSVLIESDRLYSEENIMSLMYQNHKELFKTLNFDIWWHEDNYKEGTKKFFEQNKSFYKILEEIYNL